MSEQNTPPPGFTRGEKALACFGVLASVAIGYMAVDIASNGAVTRWFISLFGGHRLGAQTEAYLANASRE